MTRRRVDALGALESVEALMAVLRNSGADSVDLDYLLPTGEPWPDDQHPRADDLVQWRAALTAGDHRHVTTAVTVHHELGPVAVLADLAKWLGATVTIVGVDVDEMPHVTRTIQELKP